MTEARAAIFGVTCGNDVSEREWQSGADKDLQWWRAKGCDTFAPCGPFLVSGLDDSRLLLQTRLNGETVQKETTADMIFDPPTVVAFVSRYVTLQPGDLIYSGTPGNTVKLSPGDVVEVDIDDTSYEARVRRAQEYIAAGDPLTMTWVSASVVGHGSVAIVPVPPEITLVAVPEAGL